MHWNVCLCYSTSQTLRLGKFWGGLLREISGICVQRVSFQVPRRGDRISEDLNEHRMWTEFQALKKVLIYVHICEHNCPLAKNYCNIHLLENLLQEQDKKFERAHEGGVARTLEIGGKLHFRSCLNAMFPSVSC